MESLETRRDFLGEVIATRATGALRVPEMFDGKSPKEAEPLDGPSGNLLARNAAPWNMYMCGTYYEKRGDRVDSTVKTVFCADRWFREVVGTVAWRGRN